MKIPEKAPNLDIVKSMNIEQIVDTARSDDVMNVIRKANREYAYWDNFKYYNFPNNVSPEQVWGYLKFSRAAQLKRISMRDKYNTNFKYWLPDNLLEILHYIDQKAIGQILVEDPVIKSAESDRYLINSIMEEAIASSQLEGAATTRKKAKQMLRSGRKPSDKPEQMILNNYLTIKNIRELIKKPLSKELILNIQSSITKDTLDDSSAIGRFKKEGEENQVIDKRDGQLLFEPPPISEIEDRIKELCNFANKEQDDEFMHPVVKAIVLHFWLAYIHPFVDGNGRTARALFYWYMLKHEYWLFEYMSISRIIIKAPAQYARAYLYAEMDNCDLTYFLNFNLKTIKLAIKELHLYLVKQQKELKETQKFIKKYSGLNRRQCDLLYHAISHPDALYTISFHKNTHNIAYQTARTDLMDLAKKGFLQQAKQNKEFVYLPSKEIGKKLRGLKNK